MRRRRIHLVPAYKQRRLRRESLRRLAALMAKLRGA